MVELRFKSLTFQPDLGAEGKVEDCKPLQVFRYTGKRLGIQVIKPFLSGSLSCER